MKTAVQEQILRQKILTRHHHLLSSRAMAPDSKRRIRDRATCVSSGMAPRTAAMGIPAVSPVHSSSASACASSSA